MGAEASKAYLPNIVAAVAAVVAAVHGDGDEDDDLGVADTGYDDIVVAGEGYGGIVVVVDVGVCC